DEQPSLVVELREDGFSGFGEATSNPYYNIGVPEMMRDLKQLEPLITNSSGMDPDEFWEKMGSQLPNNKFALCALDLAYNDLYARKEGKKLYELWDYDISNNPLTDYTIGIDTIEK